MPGADRRVEVVHDQHEARRRRPVRRSTRAPATRRAGLACSQPESPPSDHAGDVSVIDRNLAAAAPAAALRAWRRRLRRGSVAALLTRVERHAVTAQSGERRVASFGLLERRRLLLAPRVVAQAQRLHRVEVLTRFDRIRPPLPGCATGCTSCTCRCCASRRWCRRRSAIRMYATCAVLPSQGMAGFDPSAGGGGHVQRLSPPDASAASIAAITRSVSAPFVLEKRLHGVRHDLTRPQDVALNRVEDLRARHLPLNVLRDVAVREPGVTGAATLQIEDAELAGLKRRIRAQQLDDRLGSVPFCSSRKTSI